MFCAKCGCEVDETQKFCPKCGAQLSGIARNETPQNECAENVASPTSLSIGLTVLGYLLYAAAAIDFAGMFFGYDLTGVSWSPIAIGAVGGLCQSGAEKFKK